MAEKESTEDFFALRASSALGGVNSAYLDSLYEIYLTDPNQVDSVWRDYFDRLPRVNGNPKDFPHRPVRASFRIPTGERESTLTTPVEPLRTKPDSKQVRVLQLINAYRFRGHQRARLNPLGIDELPDIPDLSLKYHGLRETDLDRVFDTGSLVGAKRASLREIIDILTKSYCQTIGAEYMHITDTREKRWCQEHLEGTGGRPTIAPTMRKELLKMLTAAEGLERYLHTRYIGKKRFSLEGAESLIPLLDELIQRAGNQGVKEVIIGMAHRGRLNVLVNTMGKLPSNLFLEFEDKNEFNERLSGDVKYHLGYSSDIATAGGPLHVVLAFNPSHLEIVGPVVEGSVRARQERLGDSNGSWVLPVIIHGDAAFAGQGVVMETINMSQSRGFSTKGTVHIIINNQIGFTTSQQQDARSTFYCSDVAKMVNAPIFHVNGDDPEAVWFITRVALDYRMTFRKDVVIDLVCYRRHGHSEADEPSVTQPLMYQRIRQLPTTRERYAQRLIDETVISADVPKSWSEHYRASLDAGASVARGYMPKEEAHYPHAVDWTPYLSQECDDPISTGVDLEIIRSLTDTLTTLPQGFETHPQVAKVLENRRKMAAGAMPIDWGYAETLAYATLLREGYGVRLSGQDSGRGTFFHRHAVIYNQKDGTARVPLRHLFSGQPNFLVVNSLLSEEAVLAFEYGYATAEPETLTIWEAQFGDFANNAQVVIDQFISSGELKWDRLSGIVLLLPHGYEGQGPEHSSARLERYLQLCAQQNMVVSAPSTPVQLFHLLRRQMLWRCRKPLIVLTPKSLLRQQQSFSTLNELCQGSFQELLPDVTQGNESSVRRVVICSGKVYFDLYEERAQQQRSDVALIRIEQLYPFPEQRLADELRRYSNIDTYVWCQEEPKNQGAWYSSQHHIRAVVPNEATLVYAGRPHSAAPAVGYYPVHIAQQRELVAQALGGI